MEFITTLFDEFPLATPIITVVVGLAAIISIVIFLRAKSKPAPLVLVPLGTNVVTKGTDYYNPKTRKKWGTILETDDAHKFEIGIRPGVLIKALNGAEVWVPRANMDEVLVPASPRQ
jgi:hypothetical protein